MKILYVSKAFFPSEITHSLSMMRMCQALADADHEVVLTGARSTAQMPADSEYFAYYGVDGGFTVRTFHYRTDVARAVMHAWNVRRLCTQTGPDLVYSRLCTLPLLVLPAGTALMLEMHTPGPVGQSIAHRKTFEALARRFRRMRIVVTSERLKKYLHDRYPHLDVIVARLSAELPISISPRDLEGFKTGHLRGDHEFNVGYTGFLDVTGLRGTQIICEIAARMPEVGFHVVGGPEDAVAHWRARAESDNLFFYGRQNPARIPWYLKCFDAVLAPVQLRTLASAPFGRGMSPLKVPQYFAYGCAIVGSDLPAHHELIRDRENGLLVRADDVDAWLSAVRLIQHDAALRRSIERGAHESYLAQFTPAVRVERIFRDFERG